MPPMLDLGPAAREVTRLLDGVSDKQLANPTPCDDYSVAALLDHFMGLSLAFTWAAHKTSALHTGGHASRERPSADNLDPGWRELLPRRLDELADGWSNPAAWEGMTEAGGMRMPAEQIGVVALDELVLHGWDLARATGQQFNCDPASTAAILAFTLQSAQPEAAASRKGLFGPVVQVPEEAPDLDKALGYAGRDPAWTPPPS